MRRDPVFTVIFPGQESGEEVLISSFKQLAAGIHKHSVFNVDPDVLPYRTDRK
ncbi:MAG: hypothetical protein ACTSRU_09810 [Candidatus Hodarchaeales archaeon]